jgi:outer membrane protein insertion porin family
MKGTKETGRLTLYPLNDKGPYGARKRETFKEYLKDFGFLSGTKTLNFLDPYFRFKFFNSAKFDQKNYDEDKEKYSNTTTRRDIATHRSSTIRFTRPKTVT